MMIQTYTRRKIVPLFLLMEWMDAKKIEEKVPLFLFMEWIDAKKTFLGKSSTFPPHEINGC